MTSLLQEIKALIASVDTKQDNLTAGDNITIVSNVISSEVSQEDLNLIQDQITAGDNITIASNVISLPSTINVSNINSTNFSSVDAIFSGVRRTPNQVYFLATRTADVTVTATGALPYNKIKTNIGNAYSNTTYRFTAPYDGTYVFFYSMVTNGNNSYQVDLRKIVGTVESTLTRSARSAQTANGFLATISKNEATFLNSGDIIYVKFNSGGVILQVDPLSSFGGFLL
jgi:hypothetical protein